MKSLDLHNVLREDAESDIIKFIESNWDSNERIEIITGNSKTMQYLVKQIADEYKLESRLGEYNSPNNGCVYIQM